VAVALVVAAGRGERLGASAPKAFVTLAGRSLYEWSLEALSAARCIDRVVIAVPEDVVGIDGSVVGGASRSESVRNALAAAARAGADEDVVLVHDAARPLVTPALVEACVAGLEGFDAVVAAAPVTDTIKHAPAPDLVVDRTLDRSALWAVQTPQVFRRDWLERALAQPAETLAAATDDAGLVEALGGRVGIVPAPRENLKITTPLDLRVAELLLSRPRAA
jgi:2-C-methyl-D-erythritol 4-phosphate cytidylyltransferase